MKPMATTWRDLIGIRTIEEVCAEYNRRNPGEKPLNRFVAQKAHDSAIQKIRRHLRLSPAPSGAKK